MNREFKSFPLTDIATFKQKMLNWANQFNIFCLLDNHNYTLTPHTLEYSLAVGAKSIFQPEEDYFLSLKKYCSNTSDWIFGHFNYDLKNKIETLSSDNHDQINFPESFLFVPEIILNISYSEVSIGVTGNDANDIFAAINETILTNEKQSEVVFQPRIDKEKYLETVIKIQEHIRHGDCYVLNFCQEFFKENCNLNPISAYQKLSDISPNPFSAFYKLYNNYVICASPERYIKKTGKTVISQPIKGTIKRNLLDKEEDFLNRNLLYNSTKDRSENVMIVDLVRNDLSKVCKQGTVKVTDLFGIYSFPQVHQMVSTIQGELDEDVEFADILKATFPMGSMTGAPKRRVLELIELYEQSKRGIYSGTIGYITPNKDFDFNVVIRSLVYNKASDYASYHVGSAITASSDPEKEFEECILKAEAIKKVLQ